MSRRDVAGSRVLITGASGGIGRELARQIFAAGGRIVITARRRERLAQLQGQLDADRCHVAIADITLADERQRIIDTCRAQLGGLDLLINNAGIGAVGRFDESTPDTLRQIMEVNFIAPVELTRLALPVLAEGHQPMVVNIGSILGHRSVPLKSEYCASKFALHGWSDSLRAELSLSGIDVLLVSPSTTDSEFFDNVVRNTTDSSYQSTRPMPAAHVARQTIRAIRRGKHEIILPISGRAIVWMDRLWPTLADRVVARKAQ